MKYIRIVSKPEIMKKVREKNLRKIKKVRERSLGVHHIFLVKKKWFYSSRFQYIACDL